MHQLFTLNFFVISGQRLFKNPWIVASEQIYRALGSLNN